MKKISVIIPHYNSRDRLIILLKTIPLDKEIEIIVVDDNSNFNIFELQSTFPHVFFFKLDIKNKGAGAARNFGLNKSSGRFLLFADSDDYFTDKAFDIIKNKVTDKFDIVYFTPTSISLKKGLISTRHEDYCSLINNYLETGEKDVLFKFYPPWSKLISRDLVDEHNIKFDEIIAANDIHFSLKCCFYSENINCSKSVIYCITESDNSLTKQITNKVIDSRFESMSRYNDFVKQKGFSHRQVAMSNILRDSLSLSLYSFFKKFFYCIYKGNPIFYDSKHFFKIIRKFV